jgi:hypothetical protein
LCPCLKKSVAARPGAFADARLGVDLPSGVWFKEGCREMSVVSENYDFRISLVLVELGAGRSFEGDDEAEPETLDPTIRRIHDL